MTCVMLHGIAMFQSEQLLKDVQLEEQRDTLSKDLSGGQKRKLSLAMALMGDPKVGQGIVISSLYYYCSYYC